MRRVFRVNTAVTLSTNLARTEGVLGPQSSRLLRRDAAAALPHGTCLQPAVVSYAHMAGAQQVPGSSRSTFNMRVNQRLARKGRR